MKKIFAVLLVLAMLVCCVACAEEQKESPFETVTSFVLESSSDTAKKATFKGCETYLTVYSSTSSGPLYPTVLGQESTDTGLTVRVLYVINGEDNITVSCSILASDGTGTYVSNHAYVEPAKFNEKTYLSLVTPVDEAFDKDSLEALFTDLLCRSLDGLQTILNQNGVDVTVADLGFTNFKVDENVPPLASVPAEEEDLGGILSGARWAYSGKMTLLGLGTVFAVLAILWGVIVLFKVFMYDLPKKKAAAQEASAPVTPSADEAASAPATAEPANDDGAVIAAITAAVAAMIASDKVLSETYAGGFRVVSFKRK